MPRDEEEPDRDLAQFDQELAAFGFGDAVPKSKGDKWKGGGAPPAPGADFGQDINHWAKCEAEGHEHWQGPGRHSFDQAQQDATNHDEQWGHRLGEGAFVI